MNASSRFDRTQSRGPVCPLASQSEGSAPSTLIPQETRALAVHRLYYIESLDIPDITAVYTLNIIVQHLRDTIIPILHSSRVQDAKRRRAGPNEPNTQAKCHLVDEKGIPISVLLNCLFCSVVEEGPSEAGDFVPE